MIEPKTLADLPLEQREHFMEALWQAMIDEYTSPEKKEETECNKNDHSE